MKHGTLLPSIHSETLNPNIRFEETPFFVQRGCDAWPRLRRTTDGDAREVPRLAGLSSFGAGGSNAHVMLQEHERPPASGTPAAAPQLIVCSGKTAERLRAYAEALRTFFAGREADGIELGDAAYTLQVGREALEHRLALVASDRDEVVAKLDAFLADGGNAPGVFTGVARKDRELGGGLLSDEDAAELLGRWVAKGKLSKLAELWVQGGELDWTALPQNQGRRRMSLPPYPFARDRFWFRPVPLAEARRHLPLHPLLDDVDAGRSLAEGLVFRKVFRADEPVVKHHVVAGRAIVPGVALLEMALAAAAYVSGGKGSRLQKVVWLSPLVVDAPQCEALLVLRRTGDVLTFEIATGGDNGHRTVHAQGRCLVGGGTEKEAKAAPRVDLPALRARLDRQVTAEAFYRDYQAIGITYGETFRTVQEVQVGAREALGRVRGVSGLHEPAETYQLPPGTTDGALQVIAALAAGASEGRDMAVPFACEEVEWYRSPGPEAFAYVAAADKDSFHIAVLDPEGEVCFRLREVSIRSLRGGERPLPRPGIDRLGAFFHRPVWVPAH
jgi:acyl transferase domain-containing protein